MRKTGIIFLAKKPILTNSQLDKLADVFIVIGELAILSMVLPFIIPGLDKSKLSIVTLGLMIAFAFWAASVLIVRRLE